MLPVATAYSETAIYSNMIGDEMESGTCTPTGSSWLEQGAYVSNMEGSEQGQLR